GADVNKRDCFGQTPLNIADENKYKEIEDYLVSKGAKFGLHNNPKDKSVNFKQMHKMIYNYKNDKTDIIVELYRALLNNDEDRVKYLINKGIDINTKDREGGSLLHYAVARNEKDIVEFIINKGADVDAKDIDGITPLHFAISKEYKEIIELLISKNADLNIKNNEGKTPLILLEEKGFKIDYKLKSAVKRE
ncbi:MAG: ankyrin repeat domain-containing protein, partial [Candidatus Firestonebacteria bacterium]|nr:ankyrin repeat domain-containing protein [Candidatus Firestonebacteria bacterium]